MLERRRDVGWLWHQTDPESAKRCQRRPHQPTAVRRFHDGTAPHLREGVSRLLLLLLLLLSMATSISSPVAALCCRAMVLREASIAFIGSVFDSTHAPVWRCRQSANATKSDAITPCRHLRRSCNTDELTIGLQLTSMPRNACFFVVTVQLRSAVSIAERMLKIGP